MREEVIIKLEVLNDSINALKELGNIKFHTIAAYKLSKNIKAINKELVEIDKIRQNLAKKTKEVVEKKYAEEKAEALKLKPENKEVIEKEFVAKINKEINEEFAKEFKEFLQTEAKLEVNKLKLKDFEDVNFLPTALMLFGIDYLIEEPKEETKNEKTGNKTEANKNK